MWKKRSSQQLEDKRKKRTLTRSVAPVDPLLLQETVQKLKDELETKDKEILRLRAEVERNEQTEFEIAGRPRTFSLSERIRSRVIDRESRCKTLKHSLSVNNMNSVLLTDHHVTRHPQPIEKGLLNRIKKTLSIGSSKKKAHVSYTSLDGLIHTLTEGDDSQFIILCRKHEMDRNRVNTDSCHVTENGILVSGPSVEQHLKNDLRFREYCGTCSTLPMYLPTLSPYPCHTSPMVPQYLEIETTVRWMARLTWRLQTVLEIGLAEETVVDSLRMIHKNSRFWCLRVGECDAHSGYCTQILNQSTQVSCVRNTLVETASSPQTLRYGVMVDMQRGRIGFVDVDRGVVLEKMNVEFKHILYPMFGVYPFHNYATVEMRLLSGGDIKMTQEKEKLILSCLK